MVSFTTSKFISGSPPKKSTSKFLRDEECFIRKSMAFLATSKLMSSLPVPKSPFDAKQYSHLKLQSCEMFKHMALMGETPMF